MDAHTTSLSKSKNAVISSIPVEKPLIMYKDYHKDVNDLISKNFTPSALWKLESKFKGPKDTLVINPKASSDGKFSADVEFAPSQCGATIKATLTPACEAKLTTCYTKYGHKLEVSLDKKKQYEVAYEGTLQNRVSSHVKLIKESLEVGLGIPVAPHCAIGCGSVYLLQGKKTCEWTASCRFADKTQNRVVAIRTNKLKTYTTSIMTQIPTCPFPVVVGAEVVCGRGQGWNGTLAIESECILKKGNTLKARVNKNKEWAVAYIAKLADNWTAAVTIDKNMKLGVLLSHS